MRNSKWLTADEICERWQIKIIDLCMIAPDLATFVYVQNIDKALDPSQVNFTISLVKKMHFTLHKIQEYENKHPELKPQDVPPLPVNAVKPTAHLQNTFKKTGDYWSFFYVGMKEPAEGIKDQKGFAYIQHLLLYPEKYFSATDLDLTVNGARDITATGIKFQNELEYQNDGDSTDYSKIDPSMLDARREKLKKHDSLRLKKRQYALDNELAEVMQDPFRRLEAQDILKEKNLITDILVDRETPEKKTQDTIRKAIDRAMKKIKEIEGDKSPLYLHLKNHFEPLQWPIQYLPANPIKWGT